jgi:hypothetical protein
MTHHLPRIQDYTMHRFIAIACLLPGLLLSPLTSAAVSSESFVTRRPDQGQYFRRAGPEDALPSSPVCASYVPAYSSIYLFEGGSIPLAINLSVRNTDPLKPIYLRQILYYGADGSLAETIMANPWILAPMATATYVINQHDMRGGAGANFVVQWFNQPDTNAPLIETVMAGYRGAKGLSLTSRGVTSGQCAGRD